MKYEALDKSGIKIESHVAFNDIRKINNPGWQAIWRLAMLVPHAVVGCVEVLLQSISYIPQTYCPVGTSNCFPGVFHVVVYSCVARTAKSQERMNDTLGAEILSLGINDTFTQQALEDESFFKYEWWQYFIIPWIAGFVGYITNVMALEMMFYPLEFWGIDIFRVEGVVSALEQ
jgi:hypothetical protein